MKMQTNSAAFGWELLPVAGLRPSSGCTTLVLDLSQLLSLESDYVRLAASFLLFLSEAEEHSGTLPEGRSSLWFSASPRWR